MKLQTQTPSHHSCSACQRPTPCPHATATTTTIIASSTHNGFCVDTCPNLNLSKNNITLCNIWCSQQTCFSMETLLCLFKPLYNFLTCLDKKAFKSQSQSPPPLNFINFHWNIQTWHQLLALPTPFISLLTTLHRWILGTHEGTKSYWLWTSSNEWCVPIPID